MQFVLSFREIPALPRRRGSVYVAVLAAAMVTTILGAGAIAIAQVQVRTAAASRDAAEARQYAAAAIEIGRYLIAQDANWRTNHTSGVWIASQAIGGGSFSLSVTDPNDNDLANSYTDAVLMTATGVKGIARSKMAVRLTPNIQPLSCLQVAACAQSGISLSNSGSAMTFRSDQTISSNGSMTSSSANVYARVETLTGASGSTYRGDVTTLSSARTLPTTGTVFNWYQSNGTAISYSSLPSSGGQRQVKKELLSYGVNPFDTQATNSKGVYYINCGGGDVTIEDSRLVCTLVLLNCGTCTVTSSVNWEPATAGFPVLLVQGKVALDFDVASLAESSTNFNPPSTPYNGVSNANKSDSYPSTLKGLIYSTGNMTLSTKPAINGNLVTNGTLSSTGGTVELSYSSASAINAPPGFMVWPPPMQIVTGSLSQQVDP